MSVVSLALVGAGIALIASVYFFAGSEGGSASGEAGEFNVSVLEESTAAEEQPEEPSGPEEKKLTVTIPKKQVAEGAGPDAAGDEDGRGSGRERGRNPVVAGSLKKK